MFYIKWVSRHIHIRRFLKISPYITKYTVFIQYIWVSKQNSQCLSREYTIIQKILILFSLGKIAWFSTMFFFRKKIAHCDHYKQKNVINKSKATKLFLALPKHKLYCELLLHLLQVWHFPVIIASSRLTYNKD